MKVEETDQEIQPAPTPPTRAPPTPSPLTNENAVTPPTTTSIPTPPQPPPLANTTPSPSPSPTPPSSSTPPPTDNASVSTSNTTNARNDMITPPPHQHEHEHDEDEDEDEHHSEDEEDDDDDNVAMSQMLEMGFPPDWCALALRRAGGSVEAAIHFCFERGGEMDALLEEEGREREQEERGGVEDDEVDESEEDSGEESCDEEATILHLLGLGYPESWCADAASSSRNLEGALKWIKDNEDRLTMSEGAERDSSQYEDDDVVEWSGCPCPLSKLSGQSVVSPSKMTLTGVPGGGFASVGTSSFLLTTGKWYYECLLLTSGCMQIGWADSSFTGNSDRGDGCGDGFGSWAFDGWRCYRWHKDATEWGSKWKVGDVIGVGVDMDEGTVSYWRNGKGEEVGMGLAFSGRAFSPAGGVYACVSFNRKESMRLIVGGSHLKDNGGIKHLPEGYSAVGDFVISVVKERGAEGTMGDFSGVDIGSELFSHSHRYNGSDASVHLGGGLLHRGNGGDGWAFKRDDGEEEP